MKPSAMIDIETLDTSPTAVVLSVGACKFNPYNSQDPWDSQLWLPELSEQLTLERTVSDDTLSWWAQQDSEILERALTDTNRLSLDSFFKLLNKYLVGMDKIWCQGPQFDMVILENLYDMLEHHHNWAYWQVSDSRTLFNMMPRDPRKDIQQDLHDAQQDAYYQAICVQKAYDYFGVKPR